MKLLKVSKNSFSFLTKLIKVFLSSREIKKVSRKYLSIVYSVHLLSNFRIKQKYYEFKIPQLSQRMETNLEWQKRPILLADN